MVSVTGIVCQIVTGRQSSTDGDVYLGLGGREFAINSEADDFSPGSLQEFVLGAAPLGTVAPPQARVLDSDLNDPRKQLPLETDRFESLPRYLRFEPEGPLDNWNIAWAAILVYTKQRQFFVGYRLPKEFSNIWLGRDFGKALHFMDLVRPGSEQSVLDRGREIAGT
jgi:hypothetical protein